ncbi:hypothetical protein DM01DRAFT_316563 [Hesseltinella vesiculosa]|uniref:Uncharacterized protein n=1 Tax=Hesseltinella vesiculosa TaxID=101127 RepID=A0A1X2GAP4_9FUNG|nr:hypothetical protein DM01DRAFT_316563 [Hesseltinella vesiculosa]
MPPQRASSLLKRSGSSASQVAIHQLVDGLHSPIQLAAISNYKLAQLTFAPPDMHSLRKTALIKNTVEYIYNITPPEWLDEMTRWEFFTLESLDEVDMTQEALETILSEYVQIMESFKSMRQDPSYLDDPALDTPTKEIQPPRRTTSVTSNDSCTSVSSSSIDTPIGTASSSPALTPAKPKDNKPPSLTIPSSGPSTLLSPTSPTSPNPMLQEQRRKSFRLNHHRISWTSDTGLSSFAASQHLAGELMSLFDMEFKIDISLNTNSAISSVAPQLPELSYFQEKKNNRSSVDSFMCLIPAFESFSIDGFEGASFVSRANKRTSIISSHRRSSLGTSPVRSSSLKYKNRAALASSGHASSTHPPMPTEPTAKKNSLANKSLSKKTSIRRLVSMFATPPPT